MVKFNDEHKEEMSGGKYFSEGVHKVQIMLVEFGKTANDKEYAEFTVIDEDDTKEDTARLWFTTDGAVKYSFNQIRNIFVHNAPEDKKEEVRKKIDAIKDTEELEEACQKLIGKEAWFTVYKDPENTWVGDDGKERPNYEKNIYGYEPQPRELTPEPKTESDTGKTSSDEEPFADF